MNGEQVSVTVWPGGRVPVPPLERYPEAEMEGDHHIWLGHHKEIAEPPPELYLRRAPKLDVENPAPLALEVARTVGGVFLWENREGPVFYARDLADAAKNDREQWSSLRGRSYDPPDFDFARGVKIHVDEVAFRLRVLDILGQHAVAYRRGDYLAPLWREASQEWARSRFKTEEDAWREFSYHANRALQVFHVRVRALTSDGHEIGYPRATVLEAGVLQIVNDLADEVDYLTCPNCATVFARQIGGSTHFSRSTGVTYCTPKCATAARVKKYRARKRAERSR